MRVAGVCIAVTVAGSLMLPLQLNRLQYTALRTDEEGHVGMGDGGCVCQSGAETNNNACATAAVTYCIHNNSDVQTVHKISLCVCPNWNRDTHNPVQHGPGPVYCLLDGRRATSKSMENHYI